MSLILHAPNVHQGGGAALLTALITASAGGMHCVVTVDERFPLLQDLPENVVMERVPPTLVGRLRAEWRLRNATSVDDVVLCLGNLPPLFRLPSKVILFLQNRLLVEDISLKEFRLPIRLRILVERLWLRARLNNVQRVLVQTPTMQRTVKVGLGAVADVLPFVKDGKEVLRHQEQVGQRAIRFDFLYVASGEPHKNHLRLIDAWQLLAAEGIRPSLCVTLFSERHVGLCRHITDASAKHCLNITNVGLVPAEQIQKLYGETQALIYPSLMESFGIPLIEARLACLPVLAAELDYVRDVLDPEQTFDPESAISIARAVKRFLDVDECPLPLLDAKSFIEQIVNRKE